MQARSHRFRSLVNEALADADLQQALPMIRDGAVAARARAIAVVPEFERLREEGKAIKDHTLAHLDFYLERFEENVKKHGGKVHWARDAAEACEIVLGICRAAGARLVTKGKSMASEEIGLNRALEAAGLEVLETDMGEYIIQLAHEAPSHIVMPAIHKTVAQVADLIHEHHRRHGLTRRLVEPDELVGEARRVLRERYFQAEVGITGANFLVAETGSNFIVTNEGNGDLTCTLARVHVVTAGIEKLVPTLEDATVLLRLLGRSATGQDMTSYTTVSTGPRRPGDTDGPAEYHVVLIDNGRSRMIDGDFREMLRCIRCGACMNHCAVYRSIGGHAYGWVYPGPMGAVLTPWLLDLRQAADLPNACTLNGHCAQVCPMKIPLPDLLRKLRRRQWDEGVTPWAIRHGLGVWAFVARRPALYRITTRVAMRVLGALGRRRGRFARLPLAGGWTAGRDLPAPQGETFHAAWKKRAGRGR